MKPSLSFIVMALVWSVPLASYAIWYVRRSDRQARRRLQMAVDQINRDTRSSTVGHISPLVPTAEATYNATPERATFGNSVRALQVRVVLPIW